MSTRVSRWEAGIAAATTLAAIGLLTANGTLLLAAAIPLVYVGVGATSTVAQPEGLRAERRIDPSPAGPGEPVTVELTVTNGSDRPQPDVRVVDGVPEPLAVVDGTPRGGTTLDAGESMAIEYTILPRRGEYAFDRPRVRVRDATAGATETVAVDCAGDETLRCALDAGAPPLSDRGTGHVGSMTADRAGRGVEFHSTREYRRGDPASRIDWRHYAKQGSLTTVNYARQLATTVVLVLDARESSRVVAGPGHPTGAELSAYAATRALTELLRTGHDVAVAVVGVEGDGPAGLAWLPAGTGGEQRRLGREALRDAVERDPAPVDVGEQARKLVELAPPGVQIALFSPALDDGTVAAVEAWAAFDAPQIVCSPDVVADNTVGGRFDQIRRRSRLAACQARGARTIDWRRGTPLEVVLEQAFEASARDGRGGSRGATAGGGR